MKTIKKLSEGVVAVETILMLISRFTLEREPQKIYFKSYGRSLDELTALSLFLAGEGFAIQGRFRPGTDVRTFLKEWILNQSVEFSLGCQVGRDCISIGKSSTFLRLSQSDVERSGDLETRYLAEACEMLRDLGVPKLLRGEHVFTPGVELKWEEGFSDSVSVRGDFQRVADLIQGILESLPSDLPLAGEVTAPLEIIGELSAGTLQPREDDRWFLAYSAPGTAPSDVHPERVLELVDYIDANPGREDALFFENLTWQNGSKTGSQPSTEILWTRERGKPAVIRVTSIDPLPKTWITALTVAVEEIVAGQEQ